LRRTCGEGNKKGKKSKKGKKEFLPFLLFLAFFASLRRCLRKSLNFRVRDMKIKRVKIAAVTIVGSMAIGVFFPALRAQETSRSAWDGVYTEEQARRGEELCAQECASCHGAELTGNDEAPALAGPAFLANWDGLTVGDLAERVRRTMPPNKLGRLTRQQIVDILGHMLKANGFPAGKTELDPKTEPLKQIRIEATKPRSN
jgi:mono/diheme cytochrome c family protein